MIIEKKISDYLKSQQTNIATSQIIGYLNHLSNAYLIHKIKRMDIVGKNYLKLVKNIISKIWVYGMLFLNTNRLMLLK
jgi:hypothetical protein